MTRSVTLLGNTTGLTDNYGNVWDINAAGAVVCNGYVCQYTANVVALACLGASVQQQNTVGDWYSYTPSGKLTSGNISWTGPIKTAPVSGLISQSAPVSGGGGGGGGVGGTPTGVFSVKNAQLLGPDGAVFVPRGMLMDDYNYKAWSIDAIQQAIPGLNFVGFTNFKYGGFYGSVSIQEATPWINAATAKKVVVAISDYAAPGASRSGQGLTDCCNWLATWAAAFKNNPYVFFLTQNEAQDDGSGRGLANMHKATYDAVRGAGNNNIIMMSPYAGDAMRIWNDDASIYPPMRNIIWNIHHYSFGMSGNDAYYNKWVQDRINNIQAFANSGDGKMPVFQGECGNAVDGMHIDQGGQELVNGAMRMSTGAAGASAGFGIWQWMNEWAQSGADACVWGQDPAGSGPGHDYTPPPPQGLTPCGQAMLPFCAKGSAAG